MWIAGSMATTSGSALTLCTGPFGRGCCQTTFSGTRRGNGTDGSTVTMGFWVRLSLVAETRVVLACAFSPGLPSYAVAGAAVGTDCAWGCQSVMGAHGRISSSTLPVCSHLEIWTLPSPSYLSVLLVFGCCLVSTRKTGYVPRCSR